MNKPSWIVKQDCCSDCGATKGKEHGYGCHYRKRTVVVEFTIKTVVAVPEDWDYDSIDFKYNDACWCADNLLDELVKRREDERPKLCMCGIIEAKCTKEADENDENDFGFCFIDEIHDKTQ